MPKFTVNVYTHYIVTQNGKWLRLPGTHLKHVKAKTPKEAIQKAVSAFHPAAEADATRSQVIQ